MYRWLQKSAAVLVAADVGARGGTADAGVADGVVGGGDGDDEAAAIRFPGSAVIRRPNCTPRSRRAPPTNLRSWPAIGNPRPRWTLWRIRFSV